MNEVTRILSAIEHGDAQAAEQLFPLVYNELRKLAARKLGQEKPGQTLQATALVHEAYVRLVDSERRGSFPPDGWNSHGHFFAAAAEAMRRILVDRARGKNALKRGGNRARLDLDELALTDEGRAVELNLLDEALGELEKHDPQSAKLVKLRYFAGLTHQQAADALGITRRAADRLWALARAWLFRRIADS